MWLAPLDRRTPPRRLITPNKAYRPFFGRDDKEWSFLGREGRGDYVFRMKSDGTASERVVAEAVIYLMGVSPDGEWVVVWVPSQSQAGSQALLAYPMRGGPPERSARDAS